MVVRDQVMLTSIWLFHYLPDAAWAGAKGEEIAEQLSKIVELQE